MSARVHRRLQASIEYMVLGDLAQCVLNALWRAGVEQRFEPLGGLTARDVILVRLRQLGMLQREGAGAVLDELLRELVAARAIRPDGDVLVLPILSADKERTPRAPAAPALTPEESREAAEAQRQRESFERSFRNHKQHLRTVGDARADDPRYDAELRAEYRAIYRPRRRSARAGGGAELPVGVPPAAEERLPEEAEVQGAQVPAEVPPVASASRVSSLSSLSENSQEREGETPDEGDVAQARARGATPGATSATSGTSAAEQRATAPGYGRAEVPSRELPERSRGSSAPSSEPPVPSHLDLTDPELGALGLEGLALGGAALEQDPSAAQVEDLGAFMRAHGLTPARLAVAGRFLRQVDVGARYHWDQATCARRAVTLDFLLGKRVRGERDGQRLLALITEGEKVEARARAPGSQGNLPLGSNARGPAAPLSIAQQRAREIAEAQRASGTRPVVSNPFGPRAGSSGPGPVSAGGGTAGASETG